MTVSVEARFWAKVDTQAQGCWRWTGCLVQGYGQAALGKGKRVRAHRYAYELCVGPIPENLVLDHLCRNPACVNPAHLEPVTDRENILRGENHVARYARQTHCMHGHELTPENIMPTYSGRSCRLCRNNRQKLRRANGNQK